MGKKKNKAKENLIRNTIRLIFILIFAILVSYVCYAKTKSTNDKLITAVANDAFVYQSVLLANNLDPNKPNSYNDIENLEEDEDVTSFVSDAAIKTGKSKYYIRVNYSANCVTVLTKDDDGNYTVPYKAMICSTGKSTPKSGTYAISYKYRWLHLFGDVYGQYSTRIVKNILFHSVPYYEQRADTLEWDEYDKLGTSASLGCIRLTVQDAKWIYDNITSGTYVEFYSDPSNPGPLGKPTAQKISSNTKCRDWDPTDPDKNNPWNGGSGIPTVIYTPPVEKPKKVETKKEEPKVEEPKEDEKKEPTPTPTPSATPTPTPSVSATPTPKATPSPDVSKEPSAESKEPETEPAEPAKPSSTPTPSTSTTPAPTPTATSTPVPTTAPTTTSTPTPVPTTAQPSTSATSTPQTESTNQ